MSRIAQTKMLAMCEGAAIVSPALMQQRGPAWLYTLQWWEGDPTYVRAAYHHPFLITLDRLPTLNSNAAPVVELRAPANGAELVGAVDLQLDVLARPHAVKYVEFLALPGPWQNWWLMNERELDAAFSNAVVVGICTAAPFAMRWVPPKPGLYSFTVCDRLSEPTLAFQSCKGRRRLDELSSRCNGPRIHRSHQCSARHGWRPVHRMDRASRRVALA